MTRNRRWAKSGTVLTAVLAFFGAVMFSGCGGGLKSESVPNQGVDPSLSLSVAGNVSKDSEGRYKLRANSKDTIEFVATVKGLSSYVGFYVPAGWGTFGGGTVSTIDGYTYYTADRSGNVRAVMTSAAAAGKFDLRAKSLDVEKTLPLTFDFSTLALFPNAFVLTDVSAPNVFVYARGGVPPIEWFVSEPRAVAWNVIDSDTIEVYIHDPNVIGAGLTATLTARDAEGQSATATITMGTAAAQCAASTISATPGAPKTSTAAAVTVISVVVLDYNKMGSASVTVNVGGAGSGQLTLSEFGSPGVFQGNYSIPAATAASTSYLFSYSGVLANCMPGVVSASVLTS